MKQQITHKQLNELSPKAFDWLVVNYWPEGRLDRTNQDLEPEDFTVGQMIEFLDERATKDWKEIMFGRTPLPERGTHWVTRSGTVDNFCDALWEAVKEVLEAKN